MKSTSELMRAMQPSEDFDAGFVEGLGSALRMVRGRLQTWRGKRTSDFPVGQVEAELLLLEKHLEKRSKRGPVA